MQDTRENNPLPQLLTVGEVAKWLRVHPNTVRRWDTKGLLTAHRIGTRGDRRFMRSDVELLLQKKLALGAD